MSNEIDVKRLCLKQCSLSELIPKDAFGYFKGKVVSIRNGKYGLYANIGNKQNVSLRRLGNRPIENIKWEEVLSILEK